MEEEWPGQRLHQFCIFDRDDSLKDLLEANKEININAPDLCARTPIYTAVSNNSLSCLQLLLEHGADPSISASERMNKMTPLHQALIDQKIDAIQLLLSHGANIDKPDSSGLSPKQLALSIGAPEMKRLFEEEKRRRQRGRINIVIDLCSACQNGDREAVQEILSRSDFAGWEMANAKPPGTEKTAICFAAEIGDVHILEDLLASVSSIAGGPVAPIHCAIESQQQAGLPLLIEKAPECCREQTESGWTPLHLAAREGAVDHVRMLLTFPYSSGQRWQLPADQGSYLHAVDINVLTPDSNKTALYLACENEHPSVVSFLLSYKVNVSRHSRVQLRTPNQTDSSETVCPVDINGCPHSCLLVAVEKGHYEIVELLLKAGASSDLTIAKDGCECSAVLLQACSRKKDGDYLMLDTLLRHGVKDIGNHVLKETVKYYPRFVQHILKYKASKDTNYQINKRRMREDFQADFLGTDDVDSLPSTDSRYREIFPTIPVYVRWQNLNALTTVNDEWLICVGNMLNSTLRNISARLPLFAITRVDVSGNCLANVLPVALLQLPSLCVLAAAQNSITKFPEREQFHLDCKTLEEIDLQQNQLVQVPDYLFTDLPDLRVLNLSTNQIERLPSYVWQTTSLKTLDLTNNQITHLPDPIGGGLCDSTQSTHGKLSETDDQYVLPIPEIDAGNIKRENHWSSLEIYDENMKSSEDQRQGLKVLKLSKNRLSEVPDFLSCCAPRLENLDMSRNRLTSLGPLKAYPRNLKTLDVSGNRITNMDSWTVGMDISGDQSYCGHSLSVSPGRSSVLGINSCSHRKHTSLNDLETIDLSSNQLQSITVLKSDLESSSQRSITNMQEIDHKEQETIRLLLFPNLVTLELNNNKFSSLPTGIGALKSLRNLSLKMNENLKELRSEVGLLNNLTRIELELCPLEGPIQDIRNSSKFPTRDIVGFLHSVLEESEEYNCMNLMVVGKTNIGKTSLLEHLGKFGKQEKATNFSTRRGGQRRGPHGELLSTVGIDISQLSYEGKKGKVEFRTWDFAGQREYYATHQYFLSPRSLYLVLWNITDGEPGVEGLRQWLVNIQAQAPGAPVIIVGTHLDKITSSQQYPADWEKSLQQLIREKYQIQEPDKSGLPFVFDSLCVGCDPGKRGQKVDKLKEAIYKIVFELKHPARRHENLLGHKVPKKYIKLQHSIKDIVAERYAENKEPVMVAADYILTVMNKMDEGEGFRNKEDQHQSTSPAVINKKDQGGGFRNKEDLHQATRFLHENGVLCHFQDAALKDLYFIDPQWLCDQLAIILSFGHGQGFVKGGIMKIDSLQLLYKDSKKMHEHIVNLLNKFEVALQFDDNSLIIPPLLPSLKDFESSAERTHICKIPVKRSLSSPSQSRQSSTTSSLGFRTIYNRADTASPSVSANLSIIKVDSVPNPTFSYCRLYLLTYFPSGFWPRLITRVLADESFHTPAMNLLMIPPYLEDRCPDLQNKSPMWRCWQTGLELLYFEKVIFHVKEVQSIQTGSTMCNYVQTELKCYFDDCWNDLDVQNSAILEVSFPTDSITFSFGENSGQNLMSLESKTILLEEKAQAKILAKIVEHIDCLLQDWYPELGEARFIQSCLGRYLVTRVIPCPLCLTNAVRVQNSEENPWVFVGKDEDGPVSHVSLPPTNTTASPGGSKLPVIHSFLVEKCIMNMFTGQDEICEVHGSVSPKLMGRQDGVSRQLFVAPDVQFSDLDQMFVVEGEELELGRVLGRGAFGEVYAGKLKRNESTVQDVAVKVLYSKSNIPQSAGQRSSQLVLEQVCMAYTTARQEVSILQTVQHSHIVPLLGISKHPLALLLSLAPKGSLCDVLKEGSRNGLPIPPFVIKNIVVQVSDALDYLHDRNIIYRDLKSDNVLVWHFPPLTNTDPRQPVSIKLADYGISRPMLPAGARGFGGTPPFIAPEILISTGKDTYSTKVDIFSFGIFMFELLTCRQPLQEVHNPSSFVCHGGRPSMMLQETTCPSHMLDLMTLCWAQEAEYRPTAAQVRMMAGLPQFCHLSDAVSMESKTPISSSCSVFVEGDDTGDEGLLGEDHSQVWLSSTCGSASHIEIYSYNLNHRCIASKTLPSKKILGMCAVRNSIWCLNSSGEIQQYEIHMTKILSTMQLDVRNIIQVKSMFHHDNEGKIIILLQESRKSLLYVLADVISQESDEQTTDPRVLNNYNCAAVVRSNDKYNIWMGMTQGKIQVMSISDVKDDGTILDTGDPVLSNDCWFITTATGNHASLQNSVWTYNYPGSIVYRWDADDMKVVNKINCSCMVPTTDSHLMTKTQVSASLYQITAMAVVDKYLYIGTTWGCITIADAATLKPYCVFRCHSDKEFYIKYILLLGRDCPRDEKDHHDTHQGRGILTVGRGYMDVVNQVLQKEQRSTNHTYLLSWIGNMWEYY